jgi:putative peptidoglycan lipid II flippase
MSLIRRAGTVGGLTLLSRFFGFGRDVVMAAVLGAGPLADAFMVAFRLPNHFRAILAEGAFNSAFVPTYSAIAATEGDGAARRFRSVAMAWLLTANLALLAIALAATGLLIAVIAPGLGDNPAQRELVIDLTRITFPYLTLISATALISGVLNAHDRFAAAAAAPILLNVAMAATLLAAWIFPTVAHAAAWGVLAGGVAQLVLVGAAVLRAGLGFDLVAPRRDSHVMLFLKRFGPAVLGAAGVQIAMFADTIIATFLPSGSLSYLYYADRLYQLPLAVIGIAIGTALLPDLARRISKSEERGAATALGHAVSICLIFGIPCAVGLAMLGELIMQALFARGAFTQQAVEGSAGALAAYSLGLPAAIALRGLVSGFHARGDTVTPVKALAFSTVLNVALKLILVAPLAHIGVWLYAGLLALWLRREGRVAIPPADRKRIAGSLCGSALMALAIYMLAGPAARWVAGTGLAFPALVQLLLLGAMAALVFAVPMLLAEVLHRRGVRS